MDLDAVTFIDSECEDSIGRTHESVDELQDGNLMIRFNVQEITAGGNGPP